MSLRYPELFRLYDTNISGATAVRTIFNTKSQNIRNVWVEYGYTNCPHISGLSDMVQATSTVRYTEMFNIVVVIFYSKIQNPHRRQIKSEYFVCCAFLSSSSLARFRRTLGFLLLPEVLTMTYKPNISDSTTTTTTTTASAKATAVMSAPSWTTA